jgi:hypothetical protein
MALNPAQRHALAVAFVTVITAVRSTHIAGRVAAHDQAELLADTLVFGLARQGFVVDYDPQRAGALAAEMEREEGARLT